MPRPRGGSQRARLALASVAALSVATLVAAPATANDSGFKTSHPAMLQPVTSGATVEPLITVGDTLAGGYRFEALPDGIALWPRGRGRVDVYLNHETSTVPFPYVPAGPTAANSQNDFDNAQLSRLVLNQHSGGILHGSMVIDSAEGFQRFCSSYLATEAEGFERPILLQNEEAVEWVNRAGASWPSAANTVSSRQSGVVVAYDVRTGQRRPIWGMGRLNHENSVAIPGYGRPFVLTGDDTFASNPAQSQVYAYTADSADAVWNDAGSLWAFVADDPAVNDYYDFAVGSQMSTSGHFIKVPRDIATGRDADGSDLVAADKGYPAPPGGGAWATDASGTPVDGPQWVLERWGDINGVFQFVRIEDIAYDKRPGKGNIVYLADSGRGATSAGGNAFTSSNGRIWRMVLDPADPTKVISLSVLIEGDDRLVKDPDRIHQPDNLETTASSLLVTEDPGSSQHFNPGDANATTARLWRYDLASGSLSIAARVDQSADGGPTDVDGLSNGRLGAWESSGVVDASAVFGPGAFLVTVQAHTLWVEKADGPDLKAPVGPDWTYKREGGQLVLLRIPGA